MKGAVGAGKMGVGVATNKKTWEFAGGAANLAGKGAMAAGKVKYLFLRIFLNIEI